MALEPCLVLELHAVLWGGGSVAKLMTGVPWGWGGGVTDHGDATHVGGEGRDSVQDGQGQVQIPIPVRGYAQGVHHSAAGAHAG